MFLYFDPMQVIEIVFIIPIEKLISCILVVYWLYRTDKECIGSQKCNNGFCKMRWCQSKPDCFPSEDCKSKRCVATPCGIEGGIYKGNGNNILMILSIKLISESILSYNNIMLNILNILVFVSL
jgi:hypothetical protein